MYVQVYIILFFPFQLQVGLQANVPQPHDLYEEDDDVDAALSELQVSLEGKYSVSVHSGPENLNSPGKKTREIK